jgi:signal transduction histidine kinase
MWWAASCAAFYLAALLAVVWSRGFAAVYLYGALGALGLAALALLSMRRGGGRWRSVAGLRLLASASGVLTLAVGVGFVANHRLEHLTTGWTELVEARQARQSRELDARMGLALARGRQAVGLVAALVGGGSTSYFQGLAEVRARTGVEALALFDSAGEPLAWAGDHHGPFPPGVRGGAGGVSYEDRPLFSYLYFSVPVEGRGVQAVAAILLQTGLDPEQHVSLGLAERFGVRTGARPFFGPGPGGADSWSLVVGADTIAHAQFESVSQSESWWAEGNSGRRVVLPLVGVAFFLATLAWYRGRARSGPITLVPLLGAMGLLVLAPLGEALGAERLFSPALFLLPVQPELTLGRLLTLLVPLAALTAALRPAVVRGGRSRAALLLGGGAVLLGFPAALELLLNGAAPSLPHSVLAYWFVFQPAVLLVLTVLAVLALPQDRSPEALARRGGARASGLRLLPILGGVVVALALAGAVLMRWRFLQRVDTWFIALWAFPFVLLALGVRSYVGRGSRLVRWLIAGGLAASAVLPQLWVVQVEARLQEAERGVATLGLRPDPYLDYLLHQFAADVMRRGARGEEDVALLYRSWATSGLARESYPARIGLWGDGGRQVAELVLGDPVAVRRGGAPPSVRLRQARERALESGTPVLEPAQAAASGGRLLAVPLGGGRGVTVFVPPRRSFDRPAALVPILGPEPNPELRLTLIPTLSGSTGDGVVAGWERTEQGWRSEALLRYPEGEYHAHLDVHLPSVVVILARGVLLLALDLGLLALLWVVGRAARGDPPTPPGGWRTLAESFRARVTVALFGFFLLPTVVFGTLAYRALAGEAARTARYVAERAALQAVALYPETPGNWRALATRVGEEVLYFHRGELAQASSPEAVELGIFGAWMPPAVYQNMKAGEAMSAVESRRLGRREYLVAYRRLPAGTLAVPVPVVGGETALRQRELADLLLFAVLLGGVLSLTLSVAVGRALARPIGQLRRASAAVGGGRLSVRLPETDAGEFGELFGSFNRMVRRLRRARAQELRAARVLAWGEMSRQVAHEIKNPLTPIKLSVQHLRRAYADGRSDFRETLETNVDQILTEIDRLTEIARLFSRYGAPAESAGPLEVVEVAPVVREALLLYRAGESGVQYQAEVEAELPPIRARTGELKEVLLNLLENAHTALDGRGTVTVEARRAGEVVELVVRDDGPGVPPELLSRIFEPQFSTSSSGTGLGLAIVRRIVEDWGGVVTAESTPGGGTAIMIRARAAEGSGVGHQSSVVSYQGVGVRGGSGDAPPPDDQ